MNDEFILYTIYVDAQLRIVNAIIRSAAGLSRCVSAAERKCCRVYRDQKECALHRLISRQEGALKCVQKSGSNFCHYIYTHTHLYVCMYLHRHQI